MVKQPKILSAPIRALLDLKLYDEALRGSLSRGFLYLVYFSLIVTFIFFIILQFKVLPIVDEFALWAEKEMPPLTWEDRGLKLNVPGPYTMNHVELGAVVIFDTDKEDVAFEDVPDVFGYVTSTKIYVRQSPQEIRMYDIRQTLEGQGRNLPAKVRFDGAVIQEFYKKSKPFLVFVGLSMFFPFFCLWKLMTVLFYSLVGLLITKIRRADFSYSAVLNVSFFAITAASLIQILQVLIPFLGRVPFGFPGGFVVTSVYLFLALKPAPSTAPEESSRNFF